MKSRSDSLGRIAAEVRSCRKCPLWKSRTNAVPGSGLPNASLMLVGEAPGRKEDEAGLPFVGSAGKILDSVLKRAGIRRQDLFITNVVKCRPPGNRRPTELEAKTCHPYLRRQMDLVSPELVFLLGTTAVKQFLPEEKLSTIRGRVRDRNGQKFLPTYHPAALIYNPRLRRAMASDLKLGARSSVSGKKVAAENDEDE